MKSLAIDIMSSLAASLFAALSPASFPNVFAIILTPSSEFLTPTFATSSKNEVPSFVSFEPPLIVLLIAILGSNISARVPNIYWGTFSSIPRYFMSSTPCPSSGSTQSLLPRATPARVLGISTR